MPLWKRNHLARYMDQATDGTTGSAGGAPDLQAQIAAAVEAATTGLKAKNSELLGSLRTTKDALQKFDGIDPDAVRNILKRFTDDDEAKLIANGKIDEVLTKRTERMKADYDKQLAAAQGAAEAASKRAQAFQGRVLDDSIRAAAAKAGIHQHAIDDALFRGRAMFSLDEQGAAVAMGDDGRPVLGKDGKSPFSPLEWLEGMKEKAPHWFPATASGSGASGSGGAGVGGKTMTRSHFETLRPQERAATIKAGTKVVD
jgi:hypothetical protein